MISDTHTCRLTESIFCDLEYDSFEYFPASTPTSAAFCFHFKGNISILSE